MKRLYLSAAALALSSAAAMAAVDVASADADGDGFVSEAEAMAVYVGLTSEEFVTIDMNGDARIDPTEIQERAAQDLLLKYSPEETADAVEGVGNIDTDADGFASEAELMAAYPGLTSEEFVTIDANGDARVDPDELYAASAQELVKQYSPDATPTADLAMFDTDGDGFATEAEIMAVFADFDTTFFDDIDLNDDQRVSAEEFQTIEAQDILKRYM